MDSEKSQQEAIVNEGIKELIDVIDECLPNSYKVLEGDVKTLYIEERTTGKHFKIKVTETEG